MTVIEEDPILVEDALVRATHRLTLAGMERPMTDALTLFAEALGVPTKRIADVKTMGPETAATIDGWIARLEDDYAPEYIFGRAVFHGMTVMVNDDVLVPDPDSRFLVDLLGDLGPGATVHEPGTGSGTLALFGKLMYPKLEITGSDISADAIAVAELNADRLRLDVGFSVASWMPPGEFDMVIANLPYVDKDQESMKIGRRYRHQPDIAKFTDGDGMASIRGLMGTMRPGQYAAIQHAESQIDDVREYFRNPRTAGQGNRYACFTYGNVR